MNPERKRFNSRPVKGKQPAALSRHLSKMEKQLARHIEGVVDGFAESTHLSGEVAEVLVRSTLEGLVEQMKS